MANDSSVLVRLRLLGAQSFARGARQAGGSLSSIERGSARASSRLHGVNNALAGVAGAMRIVGSAAGVGAAAGLAYGVKKGVDFEQSMANVQARLLTTKGNMELLSQQAMKLGANTSFSANQAAEAMGEFAAAGFDTSQIMKIMPGTMDLAAASGTDLAFAAETTGAMIRQFGLHASDAGHVADLMTVAVNKSAIGMDDLALTMKYVGPVAGRFNQKIEDVGAAAAILGNVGIKGETAGTTLRRAFVNLVKPSTRTMNMLDDMGITTKEFSSATVDASGKLRPMPKILGNLAGHFSKLTKPDQRKALAQLFGVEALPGMLTLMGKGQKGIEKMSAQLTHSGGAARKTAAIMRGTVKGAWDQFTGSIETASIRLTRRFQPAMRGALGGAAKLTTKLSSTADAFIGGLAGDKAKKAPKRTAVGQNAAPAAAATLSPAAAAGVKFRGVMQGVVAWGQAQLPKLGAALASAGEQLVEALKPAMPFITNIVVPVLKGLLVGVLGTVVGAFKVLVPVIKIVATALGFVGKLAAPLKPVFFGVGVVIGALVNPGGPVMLFLGKLKYVGGAIRVLMIPLRLIGPVFGFVGRMIGKAAQGFQFLNRWLAFSRGGFGRMAGTVTNFVSGVIGVLARLPGRAVALLRSMATRMVGFIKGGGVAGMLYRAAKPLGGKVVDGIVDAVKAAPAAIASALAWVVNHLPVPGFVKGKVRDLLGVEGAATGGVIKRSGMAIVGERGPELATFNRGTTIYDADQTAAATRRQRARATLSRAAPIFLTANLHLSGKQIHSEVFKVERGLVEAT